MTLDTVLAALIVQWRELAEVLKREGCLEAAATTERRATELETLLHTKQNEPLTIDQASRETGRNAEYLRRVLRETPSLNAGQKGKPRIRRCDLPAKKLVRTKPQQYDTIADAQALLRPRQG